MYSISPIFRINENLTMQIQEPHIFSSIQVIYIDQPGLVWITFLGMSPILFAS